MRVKRAHAASFQEDISAICTNRLWTKVVEYGEYVSTNVPPPFPVWVTGQVWGNRDKRTWWQHLIKTPKESSVRISSPVAWKLGGYKDIGRKDRKLVLQMEVKWQVEGDDARDFWWENEEVRTKDDRYVSHYFVTDLEIFPLTPQQAAFVGAKHLKSESQTIFWSTTEDVAELEKKFPISHQ